MPFFSNKRKAAAGAGATEVLPSHLARFALSSSIPFGAGRAAADWHHVSALQGGDLIYISMLRGPRPAVYAVKKLGAPWSGNRTDERRAMMKLAHGGPHPGVVEMLANFRADGDAWMAMELFGIGNLADLVGARRGLPLGQVALYARQLAAAVIFVHKCGLIHRDVKCENVFLRGNGHAVLGDFASAYHVPADQPIGELIAHGRIGTDEYMAPELDAGDEYNHTVDWWALGITIYVMLYNQFAFIECKIIWGGEFVQEVNPELSLFLPKCRTIPVSLQDLLCELLEKNPRERLDDAHVLRHPFFAAHRAQIVATATAVPGFDLADPDAYSVISPLPEGYTIADYFPEPEDDAEAKKPARRSSLLSLSSSGSMSSASSSESGLIRGWSEKIAGVMSPKKAMKKSKSNVGGRPAVVLPNVSYLYDM